MATYRSEQSMTTIGGNVFRQAEKHVERYIHRNRREEKALPASKERKPSGRGSTSGRARNRRKSLVRRSRFYKPLLKLCVNCFKMSFVFTILYCARTSYLSLRNEAKISCKKTKAQATLTESLENLTLGGF